MPLLRVNDLKTYFDTEAGIVKAVDGISFTLEPEQTLGLVHNDRGGGVGRSELITLEQMLVEARIVMHLAGEQFDQQPCRSERIKILDEVG